MYEKFFKRLFDIAISLIGIIILLPIYMLVGLLVLVFLGHPVIFKQPRPGKNAKIFNLYKFRTMTDKKDKEGNLLPDAERLPKFGKILRKTSFDELPELFNILFGKMSFIGPRPMLVRDMVFFDENVMKRQSVTPGLTGLAQANGRNSINWDDRFKYDLEYVKNITFMNDIKIAIKTVTTVLKSEGIGEDGGDLSIDYGDYLLKHKRVTKKEYNKKQKEAKEILKKVK